MKPPFLLYPALFGALLGACLTGCVSSLDDGPGAVPAPLPEIRSLAPAPGMVWIAGSWHWNDRAYVWIPGRWETAPPPLGSP